MAGRLTLDQLVHYLGISATAARHTLDVKIGVRIPNPQQKDTVFDGIFVCLVEMNHTYHAVLAKIALDGT